MRSLSIVLTYYNSPKALERQMHSIMKLRASFDGDLELIVVDDGSKDYPAETVMQKLPGVMKFAKLFRMSVDIPWNHRSARNVGAWEASKDWLLLLDIDTVILPSEFREHMADFRSLPGEFFMLPRRHSMTLNWMKVHHDTLLINRSLFWEIGGYDETFAGYWGAGPFWLRRAERLAKKIHGNQAKFLEWIGDEIHDSQTKLVRKNTVVKRIKIRLLRLGRKVKLLRHRQLTFSYVKVF